MCVGRHLKYIAPAAGAFFFENTVCVALSNNFTYYNAGQQNMQPPVHFSWFLTARPHAAQQRRTASMGAHGIAVHTPCARPTSLVCDVMHDRIPPNVTKKNECGVRESPCTHINVVVCNSRF